MGFTNGRAEHQLELGIRRLGLGDDLVIDLLVLIQRHASALVVHADEDAQHVGLQVERVLLPTLLQVEHGVAADAAIEEVELQLGERRPVLGGDDEDITVPQDVVRVGTAPAVAVRDRVALEQDAGTGRERGDGFGGVEGDQQKERDRDKQRHEA